MVGDNPAADIDGASAAGIPAILVHRRAPCAASFVFDTLSEIADVL
jgi:FMN phosphatase YigB (HAD superfamily)